MPESTVGVSPDGGGPKVRTLSITEQQTDGTFVTTQMQVVAIANADGTLVEMDWDSTIVELLRTQNSILRAISFQLGMLHTPPALIEDFSFYNDSPVT